MILVLFCSPARSWPHFWSPALVPLPFFRLIWSRETWAQDGGWMSSDYIVTFVTFVTEPCLAYLGRLMQNLTSYLRRAQLTRIFWCRLGFESKGVRKWHKESDTSNRIYMYFAICPECCLARDDSRSKLFGLLRVLLQKMIWMCIWWIKWWIKFVNLIFWCNVKKHDGMFSFPLRWRAQSDLSPDSHQVRSQRWIPHPTHILSPKVHGSSGWWEMFLRQNEHLESLNLSALWTFSHLFTFIRIQKRVFFPSILPRACGTSEHKGAGGAVNSKTAWATRDFS